MQAMAGGFDEFFKAQGLNDVDYSMGGCPFIMGVRRYARKYACDEFVEDVYAKLALGDIKTVIILDRRNAYLLGEGATFDDGRKEPADLRIYPVALSPNAGANQIQAENERLHIETLLRLRKMGLKVIIIYPVPEIGIHVPDALARHVPSGNLPLTLDRNLHDARQAPLAPLKEVAENDIGILEINPVNIFCNKNACQTHSDEEVYYTDRDHLSRAGTELLLNAAGPDILNFISSGD